MRIYSRSTRPDDRIDVGTSANDAAHATPMTPARAMALALYCLRSRTSPACIGYMEID